MEVHILEVRNYDARQIVDVYHDKYRAERDAEKFEGFSDRLDGILASDPPGNVKQYENLKAEAEALGVSFIPRTATVTTHTVI